MMHEGLWVQLGKLDPAETARRAGCEYICIEECPDGQDSHSGFGVSQGSIPNGYWVMTFLNRKYEIDPIKKTVRVAEKEAEKEPVGFLEQLCILAYLIKAQDIPLSDTLVKAEQLSGGDFFFRGIHALPTEELAEALGEKPTLLLRAGQALGGRRCEYGDASIEIFLLPRLPVTIIIWAGDQEFASRASILFDRTAADQIALDALWAGVNLMVKALLKYVKHA
jgi:hypothetical protein